MKLKVVLILVGMLALGGVYYAAKNNQFVGLDQNLQSQWAQVESNLQRRADLIPNLVATVKGSAKLDKEVYTGLAEARAKLAGGSGYSPERVRQANQFEGALSRLLAVVENYPALASQQGFRQLQDELAGTENRINVARRDFNDAVRQYNTAVSQVPGSLVAAMTGRKPAVYFEAQAGAKTVPEVTFP